MGDADCQYDLAFMLMLGELGEADEAEYLDLFRKSAQQGHLEAMRLLRDLGKE